MVKASEMELPIAKPVEARKGEGLLLIEQNNAGKELIINGVNDVLETMLGYAHGEITNRRLETILGRKETQMLADDLEYLDIAPDIGDILSRWRELRLRRRLGDEIRVNFILSRLMSHGQNARFQVVIPNEHERVASIRLGDFIILNLDGRKEIDPSTGLPNRKTAQEFLPVLKNYMSGISNNIVFAVIRVDRYEKSVARYGKEACVKLLNHVISCCQSAFRQHDLIFTLSEQAIGVVMFDISRESARVVLNRLRWKIRDHRIPFGGKNDFTMTTCIGFDMLTEQSADTILDRCENAVIDLDANERNALIELDQT